MNDFKRFRFSMALFLGVVATLCVGLSDQPCLDGEQSKIVAREAAEQVTDSAVLPSQTGHAGDVLTTDGTNTTWGTVSATPGGSSTHVQFNDSGAFGGDANFVYDKANDTLTISNLTIRAGLITNFASNGAITISSSGSGTATLRSPGGAIALDCPGAISIGDSSLYQILRDSTGFGWSVGLAADANVGWLVGRSMGIRGATATGNTTIGNTDSNVVYYPDATGGSFNIVLPAVNQNNRKIFYFQKFDNTTNEVHICAPSGTLIDNKTNYVLRAYKQSVTIWNVAGNSWATLQQSPMETQFPRSHSVRHVNSKVVTGNSLAVGIGATSYDNGQVYQNPAAINDAFRMYFPPLEIGTYTLTFLVDTGTNRGILSVDMISDNGRTTNRLGTIDNYAGVAGFAVQKTISSVAITNYGAFVLHCASTNKNASSSDYFQVIDNACMLPDAP